MVKRVHLSADILKEAVQRCVLQDCSKVAFIPEKNSASWVSLCRWKKFVSAVLILVMEVHQKEICQDIEAVLAVYEGHVRFLPFVEG